MTRTVALLPVAGPRNPYQHLTMAGLNKSGRLRAFNGVHDRFFGIIRTVVKYRPDWVHFDWIASYYYRRWRWFTYLSVGTFCLQVLLARGLGVKVVWTLHNILPHDARHPAVHRFCQRFLARRCDWIRVFSERTLPAAAAELRMPAERFRVVPEGDYTGVYPNTVKPQEARKHLSIPPESRVLLYLGLVKPYKGVLELVKMFNEEAAGSDHLLYVVGESKDAAYAARIRQEAGKKVVFADRFVPEDELQYYYNAADMVVLPFQQIENSGSVIMAMGFSKPVIAPALGVLTDRLCRQRAWLYENRSELRALLRRFLTTPAPRQEWRRLGAENRRALRYGWEDFSPLFV